MNDLKASQTFANDAGANTLAFDLSAQTVVSGSKSSGNLTISYDATDKSYTVTLGGQSDKFLPADISGTTPADTRYTVTGASGTSLLTLVSTPYSGSPTGQYVRMGYLQRNVLTGTRQDTEFATFTYGLDTPAAGVPRTGSAAFAIDVFGLASTPGHEPRVFQGTGTFATDFANGLFTSKSSLTDYNLLTGGAVYGGSIFLNASGHLSSSNGTFSGYAAFDGDYGQIPGTLAGRFYGPSANELGASFSGTSGSGAAITGSFTGTRDSAATLPNFTLTNLTQNQVFTAPDAWLSIWQAPGQTDINQARTYEDIGQLTWQGGGTFTYGPGSSALPHGQFTSADLIASNDPNFTAYRKALSDSSGNPQDATLLLYKPGTANSELALTYTSFGHLSTTAPSGFSDDIDDAYFVYGLETQQFLMLGRTGTAQYRGVAYGSAANETTDARYDVTGSSQFDVDFSAQTLSGALTLHGAGRNGAASLDFGRFDFAGGLAGFVPETTLDLMLGGAIAGSLRTRFYGPGGEEIGGPFTISVPGNQGDFTRIAGVTVAKQQ